MSNYTIDGGVIYILTNPSFPDYVKIGYAKDLDARLRQLNRTECTPFAFRAYATYEVPVGLSDKKLHALIDKLNPDLRSIDNCNGRTRVREFYAMPPQDAYSILEAIAGMHGFEDRLRLIDPSEGEAEEMQVAEEIARERRSRFSFDECGIPYGSTLEFWYTSAKPSGIRCTVLDDRHVEYDGGAYTLSGLAGMLLNRSAVRGPSFFKYNGEWLNTIRERMENTDERRGPIALRLIPHAARRHGIAPSPSANPSHSPHPPRSPYRDRMNPS